MKNEKITCPYCKKDIIIKSGFNIERTITCPNCNGRFILFEKEKKIEEIIDSEIDKSKIRENKLPKIKLLKIESLKIYIHELLGKFIGIILISLGVFLLINFLNNYINYGISLIIIGISFIFLISDIKNPKKNIILNMIKSEKITILFTIWILISLQSINQSDFRLLLVILMIGFLIIKETTRSIITENLEKKMKIFVIVFFLTYLMIIGEKLAIFIS